MGFSPSAAELSMFKVKSLNENVRKNEISRIVVENQNIIRRLQNQISYYDADQWEKEHKIKEKHLKSLCNFPDLKGSKGFSQSSRRTSRVSYKKYFFLSFCRRDYMILLYHNYPWQVKKFLKLLV